MVRLFCSLRKECSGIKKRWQALIGLSLLAGISGNILLKKRNTKDYKKKKSSVHSRITGTYWFQDSRQKNYRKLEIKEPLLLYIDDRKIDASILSITPQQIILQDRYGYQLTLFMNETTLTTLYDEEDEQEYTLLIRPPDESF